MKQTHAKIGILLALVIGIQTLLFPLSLAHACDAIDFYKTVLPKLLTEQQTFTKKIDELLKKPDTSTPYLTEQGVTYLRDYHKKIQNICQDMYKDMSTCEGKVELPDFNTEHTTCTDWIDEEISVQRRAFEQVMIHDAATKKFQFVVNKYRDLNKKFRNLVALMGMIRGELERLLKNIGQYCAAQHQGGN